MLTQDADYFYWDKADEPESLSPSFSTREFACHCSNTSCVSQRVAKELVVKLQAVRDQTGQPITVTSGYRCHEHQLELSCQGAETATGISQHELGNAADVQPPNLYIHLYQLFNALGKASSFTHVDLRSPHSDGTKRLWSYSRS